MKNNLSLQKQNAKKTRGHRLRYDLVSLALCVSILISAFSFALPAIALTIPEDAADASAAQTADRQTGENDGDCASATDEAAQGAAAQESEAYESAAHESMMRGTSSQGVDTADFYSMLAKDSGKYVAASAQQSGESGYSADTGALQSKKDSDLASTGEGEYAGKILYTDRTGDIGVTSEGYTDSPWNEDVHATDLEVNLGNHTSNAMERTGGTLFLERETYALGTAFLYYNNEQEWDGKAPIRVTGEGHTINVQAVENDFQLENNYGIGDNMIYHPNFPIKFDHLNYRSQLVSQNFWARGNKMVFGEGFENVDNSIIGDPPIFRVFGGAEHQTIFSESEPKTIYPTNLVLESGRWDEVYGGGRANTAYGTNVTVRGDADIAYLAGGGDDEGQVGVWELDSSKGDASLKGTGVNVYVENGTVGYLYGGSRVAHAAGIETSLDNTHLKVNSSIKIDISGGHVDHLVAGSDTTSSNNSYSIMGDCYVYGDAIVNITSPNSVGSAAGDANRNIPRSSTTLRQVQGITQLNVSASNDFTYFDLFDFVNITGNGTANSVVVTSDEKVGESFSDPDLTFWGATSGKRDGFIGSIRVADGAKLVLDHGGTINKSYYHYASTGNGNNQSWQNVHEGNIALKGSANSATHYLSKSWIGETSEARRNLSTLAINGSGSGITAASGTSFHDGTDVCGLRIFGNVQGQIATRGLNLSDPSAAYDMNVPGYSTLEVTDTPMYSTGDDYYYYVVADSSANGGKAFREPANANYIVCYRYLDNGTKIGWYLREKPSVSINNKLVRAGDTANGEMVMSVTMNGFGYEWSNTAENTVDFRITKTTGTDSNATTTTENVSLATIAGIKTDTSGRFRNVVTETVDGVERLVSFDYVIDNSTPVDPTYYTVEADCHVVRDNGDYDDVHAAATADAARCVYDFAGNDNYHSAGGYDDSIMTTYPYSTAPAGDDTALLRVYLPYGTTGALAVAENDNHFRFTTDTTIDAQLDTSTTVTSNYTTANESTANSHFGVTIDGSELSSGVTKTLSSTVSEYICTVYSYKNLSLSDISQLTASGLQLNLTVSGLTKDGESVGNGNPSAVNNGELQIQAAVGTYKITFHFTTRTQGDKVFVVKGNLSETTLDANGQLTEAFILSKAPYESNYGENLNWNAANIIHSNVNGVVSADLTASQSNKQVSLNYRLTASGPYTNHAMVNIGANCETSDAVAAITVDETNFKYWEIRKSASTTAPVYARCYDAEFSYCIMDDYWISPVFDDITGDKSARLNPDALKGGDEDWLAWTYHYGAGYGEGELVFPSEDLTFTGLKDYVIFVRVPKGTTSLGDNWSKVWNQTANLELNNYDGKTFVLTGWNYGEMLGEWSDTITLTQTEYTRNRWTDNEGVLTANGRSDYLYSDFEIAYKDGAPGEIYESSSYRTGVVFELCGTLAEGASFTPDTYTYRSDATNLKNAIVSRASSYSTDGGTRRIQCNDLSTASLTNMNRIELGKSYYNTPTNANAIMKVTAYLVDSSNNVTLSNPVYICLHDTSLQDLAISVNGGSTVIGGE